MPAPHSLHPTDQTLNDYGLGKLDDGMASTVNEHLEGCADCRQRVAGLTSDSFLGRFRAGHNPSARSTPGGSLVDGTLSFMPAKAPSPPPSADTLPPGLRDHPDYEIKRELGRGGMGVVYLAHNTMLGRDEVLKVMGRRIMERPGVLERFQREIRAVAQLRHPNIVAAYSAFRIEGGLVFAMEYVEGLDLSKLVKAKGPLSVTHAAYFIHQAALGLQHAHEKKLVHRDIKPHNLMLTHDGKARLVKVLDFGLAKATREQKVDGGLTTEGQALGTPDYIAPEQILNAPDVDIRADLYSLGGTLFYLLTGRPPFQCASLYDTYQAHISRDADPLNLIRPEVPAELAALVAKMMAKEPKRRFQTPAEVAQALTPFFKSKAVKVQVETSQAGPAEPKPLVIVEKPAPTEPATIAPTPVNRPMNPEVASNPKPERPNELGDRELIEAPHVADESGRPRWLWPTVSTATLLSVLLIAWLAVILIKTEDGVIVLENVPNDAQILVDGKKVTFIWPGGGKSLEIRAVPGQHKVEVEKDGLTTFGEVVSFRPKNSEKITIRLEPNADVLRGGNDKANADGADLVVTSKPSTQLRDAAWVPLFNGKDLSGWEDSGPEDGSWKVEGGILKGAGEGQKGGMSVLVSRRSTFRNYRLRVEYGSMDRNVGFNWLIVRYGQFKNRNLKSANRGYMILERGKVIELNGYVFGYQFPKSPEVQHVVPTRANAWNVLEIAALDNKVTTTLNGEKVTQYRDDLNWYSEGSIALNCSVRSPVRIREISIQELPDGVPGGGRPDLPGPAIGNVPGTLMADGPESPANTATDPSGTEPPPPTETGNTPQAPPAAPKRIPPAGPLRRAVVGKGSWTVEGEQLVKEDLGLGGVWFGDEGWGDYDLTFEARKSAGPDGFGARFRSSEGKHYYVVVGGLGEKHYLGKSSNSPNINIQFQSISGRIKELEWFKVKISLRGQAIRVLLDDHLLFACKDDFAQRGRVSMVCYNSAARFRNIKVTAPDGTVLWEGPPDLPKK